MDGCDGGSDGRGRSARRVDGCNGGSDGRGRGARRVDGCNGGSDGRGGAHAGWSGIMGQGAGAGAGMGATPAAPGAFGASTAPAATGGFGAGAGAGAANAVNVGAGVGGYGIVGSVPAAQAGFGTGGAMASGAAGLDAFGAGVGGGAMAGMAMVGGMRRMGSEGDDRDGNSSGNGRYELAGRPVGGRSSSQYSQSQLSSGEGRLSQPGVSGFDYSAEMAAGGIRRVGSNDSYTDPYQQPGGEFEV